MTEAANSSTIFNELVRRAEALLTAEDLVNLRTQAKSQAAGRLHLTAGNRLRNALGLWADDASEKLMAIETHANQGMLLAFDADGASSALLGYLWDKLHTQPLES